MPNKKMSYGKSSSKTAAGKVSPRKRMAMGKKMSPMKKGSKNKYS